ncbi:MAG: lactonase family protein [Armatimonadetes bacterium]|nr:lactonase family protein [Armatimonadota bacterium]
MTTQKTLFTLGFATLALASPLLSKAQSSLPVYIGTYTGGLSKGIYRTTLNLKDGALSKPELVAETSSPSFLAFHPSGKYLYAVNEDQEFNGEKSGAVSSFQIDPATGQLTSLNQVSSRGVWPCHVMLDKAGKFAYIANYAGGNYTVLPLLADGYVGEVMQTVSRAGTLGSNKARQDMPHPHSMNFASGFKYLIGCDLGTDSVLTYRADSNTGRLTPAKSLHLPSGTGPRHFAFHPNGKLAFVNGELASTLTSLRYTASTGELTPIQALSTLPKDFKGSSTTAETKVHPSGKFVYVSNRGHDSIAVFTVNADTGAITFMGNDSTLGKTPRNFNIDPSGKFLIAGNQDSNSLVSFRINSTTGRLTPTGSKVTVGKPVCVRFYTK